MEDKIRSLRSNEDLRERVSTFKKGGLHMYKYVEDIL